MTISDTIISINKLCQCFVSAEARLTINTPPETLQEIKSEWERHFKMLDSVNADDDSLTQANKDLIALALNDAKVKVVTSYCKKEFLAAYSDEWSYDNVENLEEEITNIIGEVDDSEKVAKLRAKFDNLSRRVETAEKFTAFLKRLNNVAEKLTKDANTRSFIVEAQFEKSLTAGEKEFILVHGDSETVVAEKQAKLLDEKKQHLVAKVSAIERNRITELEQQLSVMMDESTELRDIMVRQGEMLEKLRKQGETRDSDHNAQINKLKASINAMSKDGATQRGAQRAAPYGGKIRRTYCDECGCRSHSGECRFDGDCFECGKRGHTRWAKKHHPRGAKNV